MTTPAKMTVFLSSSSEDLATYREAVGEAISGAGMRTLLHEHGGVSPLSPTADSYARIHSEIDASDVVIILLGHRYGPLVKDTGKSFTEIEYDYARERQKPILVYLVSDEVPWPPSAIDVDRSKVQDFKSRLRKETVVSEFKSPASLAASLLQGLSRFLLARSRNAEPQGEVKARVDSVRIIRLFLSSPGDVNEERERAARAIFRFNQSSVLEQGLFIKLIRWEDMAPQIGTGAQRTISRQAGTNDLFVGIMWNRFGTPTEGVGSGTEHEFREALQSWRDRGKPWITFYFCQNNANFTTQEQLDQKGKVLAFIEEAKSLGVIRFYTFADEFENMFYRDLVRIVSQPEFQRLLDNEE